MKDTAIATGGAATDAPSKRGDVEADSARAHYQKIHARFAAEPAGLDLAGARVLQQRGREIDLLVNGSAPEVLGRLKAGGLEALTVEALTLEEIFIHTLQPMAGAA